MKKKNLFLLVFTALIMIIGAKTCYAEPTEPTDMYIGSFNVYVRCKYAYTADASNKYIDSLIYSELHSNSGDYADAYYYSGDDPINEGAHNELDNANATATILSALGNYFNTYNKCPDKLYTYFKDNDDVDYYSFTDVEPDRYAHELTLANSLSFKYDSSYWYAPGTNEDKIIYIDKNKNIKLKPDTGMSSASLITLFQENKYEGQAYTHKKACSKISSNASTEIDGVIEAAYKPFKDFNDLINSQKYIKQTYSGGSSNVTWSVLDFSNLSREEVNNRVNNFVAVMSKVGFNQSTPAQNTSASIKNGLTAQFAEYQSTVDGISPNLCQGDNTILDKVQQQTQSINQLLTYGQGKIDKLMQAYQALLNIQHANGDISDQEYAIRTASASNYASGFDEAKEEMIEENQAYYLNYANNYDSVTGNFNTSLTGCDLLSNDFVNFLDTVLWYIRIAGVVLAIVLSLIDYIKAASGFDDKGMAAANKKFITRFILVAVLFLIPAILNFMLSALNISNTAGSIECINSISGEI